MPQPSNATTDLGDGRSVLGIDAAWTAHHPSGIALVRHTAEGWRCELLAPSYDAFIEQTSGHGCNPDQKAKAASLIQPLCSGHPGSGSAAASTASRLTCPWP